MQIERPFGVVVVPDTFDSSIIGDGQNCPRYYYWRHIRGAESETPSVAPHFGTCIHKALEMHYLFYERDLTVETIMDNLTLMMPDHNRVNEREAYHTLKTAFDRVMSVEDPIHEACMLAFEWTWQGGDGDSIRNSNAAEQLIKRYRAQYKGTEPFTLIEPREKYLEVGFKYHLFDNIYYYGRIDMIVDWPPYGTIPVDHKTSRNLGKTKFLEFNPFFQGDGYMAAVRHHYDRVGAVCINVLQTAATKHGLERFLEPRTPDHIDAWYSDALDWVGELMWRYEKWVWPRDKGGYGGYCTHWGACQFRSLCVSFDYLTVEQCDRMPMPGGFVENFWTPWETESIDEVIHEDKPKESRDS